MAGASRPTGAIISTGSCNSTAGMRGFEDLAGASGKARHPGEHPLKFLKGRADANTFAGFEFEFANGFFMWTGALFDNRDGLLDGAGGFEITEVDDGVGEVAELDGRF